VTRFFFALGLVVVSACGQVLFAPVAARAQVVVHQAALDQLAGIAPVAAVPVVARKVAHRPAARRVKVVKRAGVVLGPSALVGKSMMGSPPPEPVAKVVAKPAPEKPFVPAVPVKPVVTVAVAKPAPALPALPGVVVLQFADGDDALPGNAAAALRPVCAAAKSAGFVAIDAYAPADIDDPSAAMRLSLSRAFAVRDALTVCGVPAIHIIPRADGAAGDASTARITIGQGREN
jgi:hypothetical protein